MDRSAQLAFAILIGLQALHSIEEYVFRLYEVFLPARMVSQIVPGNPALGFALVNSALVAFGVWCYLARVRPSRPSAPVWVWLWVVIELGNGVAHPALAVARGGYFPGLATAPALFVVALYLAVRLRRGA